MKKREMISTIWLYISINFWFFWNFMTVPFICIERNLGESFVLSMEALAFLKRKTRSLLSSCRKLILKSDCDEWRRAGYLSERFAVERQAFFEKIVEFFIIDLLFRLRSCDGENPGLLPKNNWLSVQEGITDSGNCADESITWALRNRPRSIFWFFWSSVTVWFK